MKVHCAHCGEELDIMTPNNTERRVYYHGRCYSSAVDPQAEPTPNPKGPEPDPSANTPSQQGTNEPEPERQQNGQPGFPTRQEKPD